MSEVIRSAQNPKVKKVKKLLADASFRRAEGLWVAEGVRLAEEVLSSGLEVTSAFFTEGAAGERIAALRGAVQAKGAEISELSNGVMRELSETMSPQGVSLVFRAPCFSLEEVAALSGPLLVLDEVRDPGNLGAIARTALALGAAGLVASKGTVDAGNPKALRASMGALLRLPTAFAPQDALLKDILKRPLYAAAGGEGLSPEEADLKGSFALIVGQEAEGISDGLLGQADERLSIPMEGGVESLNVSAAAAIILFEASRQRRGSGGA